MDKPHPLFSKKAWEWRIGRRIRPWLRTNWPPSSSSTCNGRKPRVAVITVNYNTRPLLARLLFSLCRIPDDGVNVGPIVVVDNNSTDGSRDLLSRMAKAEIVHAILNDRQMYHGPGLNQAMAYLERGKRQGNRCFSEVDYVFVADSDVFLCRPDVFTEAIQSLEKTSACMAGEFEENEYIPGGHAHVSSLLVKPELVWRRGFHPFEEHGVPAMQFQRTVVKHRFVRLDFPFRSQFYLVHRWNSTLRMISASNESNNAYFKWAKTDLTPEPALDSKSAYIIEEFENHYLKEAGGERPDELVAALERPTRVSLKRPLELATSPHYEVTGLLPGAGYVAR